MSRRGTRYRHGQLKQKASQKQVAIKAIDMGSTDASILAGTLADASVQHMPDAEQYWLLFKKHPWVRACVRLIANAVAAEGYDVAHAEGEELDENDPNVTLIHQFFSVAFIGKTNTFRKWVKATAIDLEVFGWSFLRKKYGTIDAKKTLVGLERMDPRLIHPKLNAQRTEIESFILKRNTYNYDGVVVDAGAPDASVASAVNGTPIEPEEIIMFSLDEGGDVLLGAPSPLEALDLTCAMDLNLRHHRNSYFRNGAQTGNIFVNKEADEDAVRAAEKQLIAMKVGPRSAYKNLLLTGDWDVKSLQQSGKQEMDFIKGSEVIRDEICAVYSIPVSKLINVSGAMGQAGKGEDDETFEQECVLPLEENIYETLTEELLKNDFGIDDLVLVPKRRNKVHAERFESAALMVRFGCSGNDARDFVGLPKSDVPGMDVPLFIGATAQGVVTDEPVDPAAQQPAQDQSQELDDAVDEAKDNEVAGKAKPRFRGY